MHVSLLLSGLKCKLPHTIAHTHPPSVDTICVSIFALYGSISGESDIQYEADRMFLDSDDHITRSLHKRHPPIVLYLVYIIATSMEHDLHSIHTLHTSCKIIL